MARKTLDDFDNDYQAYADYLESAECANDDGYDVIADQYGNIYTPTDGDWTKGHGHNNVNDPRPPRDPQDSGSKGRPWKNPWLKYAEKLNLTKEELEFFSNFYCKQNNQVNEFAENKSLSKRK